MTREDAKALVRLLRRHFLMASVTRLILLGLILAGFAAAIVQTDAGQTADRLWTLATLAALCWIALTVLSARQVRTANRASIYISSGRLDLAEQHLKEALQAFSLYRTGKLLACHNLAVVAHGRKDFGAAAELCDGSLPYHRGVSRSIGRMCRILLADCRLFLGDGAAALRAIEPLDLHDPSLSLSEQLMLLPVELRCQVARGVFEEATARLPEKIRLAELLDAPKAALVHALLARACRGLGKTAAAAFLDQRAALYHDLDELADDYSILRDSAAGP